MNALLNLNLCLVWLRKPWLLKSERELICGCVNRRLATNSKSSKYQIYSTAAFFMPPTFYILSKGVPGSDKGICHFFAATFIHKTYKPPEFPCFAPNFQPKERSVFFSPFKNEIYFQFVAKLWQLCVKFCKDFSLCTMGLETCLCHTHEHHHHHLVLPEYQPETNRFLTVFRLTGSNISVIVIKIFGWIYILHNRKKAQSGSRVVLHGPGWGLLEL